ncbi:GntR family transcriptional regulator [Streptomyces griseorubiginosus]|uniref:GntR family transcriptional regulator n=1 Tax=Streptomyces griseorubiginosus TaxID=67304 RepID=UPI001AD60F3D|nr:GntR family transcriptional regulator [Streptomyces griseorubiginosus]MBO4252334.1 GntR family transcriptional regulator [Streptomyces griseorubiginosus]
MTEGSGRQTQAQSMSDKAFETLRDAIVRCELAPGAWIKASELSESLGLGRTPTMQALQRLEAAGFTRPVKRKGWQVTPVTLQSVHDILEAFEMTAPGLVALIIRNASDEQVATLGEMLTKWVPGRPASEVKPDVTVAPIRYAVQICGNPVITGMSLPLATHVERVFNFGMLQDHFMDPVYVRRRSAFLEAMAARDEKRAPEAFLKVLHVGAAELNRILQSAQSIRSVPLRIEHVS